MGYIKNKEYLGHSIRVYEISGRVIEEKNGTRNRVLKIEKLSGAAARTGKGKKKKNIGCQKSKNTGFCNEQNKKTTRQIRKIF